MHYRIASIICKNWTVVSQRPESKPHSRVMAYVPEGSEITFIHTALHFRVSGGESLTVKTPITRMLYATQHASHFRRLNNYPADPLQSRRTSTSPSYIIFISNNFIIISMNETMHTLFVLPNINCTVPQLPLMGRQLGSARLLRSSFGRHPFPLPLHERTVDGSKGFAFSLALQEADAVLAV